MPEPENTGELGREEIQRAYTSAFALFDSVFILRNTPKDYPGDAGRVLRDALFPATVGELVVARRLVLLEYSKELTQAARSLNVPRPTALTIGEGIHFSSALEAAQWFAVRKLGIFERFLGLSYSPTYYRDPDIQPASCPYPAPSWRHLLGEYRDYELLEPAYRLDARLPRSCAGAIAKLWDAKGKVGRENLLAQLSVSVSGVREIAALLRRECSALTQRCEPDQAPDRRPSSRSVLVRMDLEPLDGNDLKDVDRLALEVLVEAEGEDRPTAKDLARILTERTGQDRSEAYIRNNVLTRLRKYYSISNSRGGRGYRIEGRIGER